MLLTNGGSTPLMAMCLKAPFGNHSKGQIVMDYQPLFKLPMDFDIELDLDTTLNPKTLKKALGADDAGTAGYLCNYLYWAQEAPRDEVTEEQRSLAWENALKVSEAYQAKLDNRIRPLRLQESLTLDEFRKRCPECPKFKAQPDWEDNPVYTDPEGYTWYIEAPWSISGNSGQAVRASRTPGGYRNRFHVTYNRLILETMQDWAKAKPYPHRFSGWPQYIGNQHKKLALELRQYNRAIEGKSPIRMVAAD